MTETWKRCGAQTCTALVLLCLVASCGGGERRGASLDAGSTDGGAADGAAADAPPSDAGPLTVDRFCDELADALCDAAEACECPSTEATDCRSAHRAACQGGLLGPDARRAVDEGRMAYDMDAAEQLVAAIRAAGEGCGRPYEELGWTYRDVRTFGGVLRGLRGAGESCMDLPVIPGECRDGRCANPGSEEGRCVTYVGIGAECDPFHDCFDLDADVSTVAELSDGSHGLACVPDSTTGTYTCAAQLPAGAGCEEDDDCQSLLCDAETCMDKLPDGSACEDHRDCVNGFCDAGACAPPRADGEPCGPSVRCASAYCASSTNVCTAPGALGDACEGDGACESHACVNGICARPFCDFAAPSST